MTNLRGTGVAMVTPFLDNGAIDFESLKKLTNYLIQNQVEYLVVLGTTGESATLSKDEKKEVYAKVKEYNNGQLPFIAGIGANSTAEVLDTMKSFDFQGVDAVLSVSPFYNKPTQSGIIKHYKAIADASPKPIILYNVPGRTGANMTAETTLILAEHENIIAMKEASANFDQIMEIYRHKPAGFQLISGDDALTLPLLSCGLDGVISVIGNAYPRDFSEMVRQALGGNFKSSRELHYKLLPIIQAIFADGSPGGIKEILKEMGIGGTTLRLPLDNVNSSVKERILSLTKSY